MPKKRARFVQLMNPRSGQWTRVDTKFGRIVGHRNAKYRCPVARRRREMSCRKR